MNGLLVRRGLRWRDWPITAKSVLVVTLPLLLLLGALLAIYRLERQTASAEEDVRATLAVLSDIHEAHSLLAETAAGVRGWLLVHEDSFLDPYRDAEPRLLGVVDRLAGRLGDTPRGRRIQQLRPVVLEKLEGWLELLETPPGAVQSATRERLIQGKQKLDVLRAELRRLREEETTELEARSRTAAELRQRNLAVTLLATTVGGLGAVLASLVFSVSLVRRLRLLAIQAARLGAGEPLAPAHQAGDELGEVDQRLHQAQALLDARDLETRRARHDAEQANRAKTDFLSRTSHELRTPLNAILGYAQVLEMDLARSRAGEFATRICSAGRHLLELIDEMLDISRIESGVLRLSLSVVRVKAVVDESLALIRPLLAEQAQQLQCEPEPLPDCHVLADAQRLRQVLLNLLSNAAKFNRPGGSIRIDVQISEGLVEIGVTDEGLGLDAQQQTRLFRPFERIDAERRGVEGTGLGLALSKRLMHAMEGEIGLVSEVGRGSRFWIRLPLALATSETTVVAPTEPDPVAARTRVLLSVEDNLTNQALLETLVERRPGWTLLHARELESARTLLKSTAVDLVLLDLDLNGERGERLLEWLWQQAGARPPVVVVSADATADTVAAATRLGAQHYLTKPLDLRRFYAILDDHLA